MRRSSLRIPGRGGGRQAAPFKDLRPPGPSGGRALCAPSYQRQWVFQQRSTRRRHSRQRLPLGSSYQRKKVCQGAKCRYEHRQCLSTVCLSLAQPQCCARKSAALGASLGVGPAPPVVCQAGPATPLPAPFLRGTAPPCSNLPAIPPHLCRDESRQKCSGQAGHSRPLPLPAVGADSVSHRRSALRHSPPPSSCAACHRLRGSARIKVVAVFP